MNETKNKILLGHGGGGQLSAELIEKVFQKHFKSPFLLTRTDSAVLPQMHGQVCFTTDSYVVDPVFFPGGNIGHIAVSGTVNDLAVSGAKAMYLSASFILEEGFSLTDLEAIVESMALEAEKAGVQIVAGDTKVVPAGKADKIFITTAGIGLLNPIYAHISTAAKMMPGDVILINGDIARHGIAVLAAREGLSFEQQIVSDVAPINNAIMALLDEGVNIKFMRDATRGGLATVLCELAQMTGLGIHIYEEQIPILEPVRGICEWLGFDPLFIANEGKVLFVIAPEDLHKSLTILKEFSESQSPCQIGNVLTKQNKDVLLETSSGGKRRLDIISGEQLPRIC